MDALVPCSFASQTGSVRLLVDVRIRGGPISVYELMNMQGSVGGNIPETILYRITSGSLSKSCLIVALNQPWMKKVLWPFKLRLSMAL